MNRRSSLLVAVFLLSGCTASTGSDGTATHVEAPVAARPADLHVRRVEVGVPRWYDRPYVEFGDADHGYALFASCAGRPPSSDCPARLYATDDGGGTWRRISHPRPLAPGQRLEVTSDVPALLVAGDGWYYSLDDGTSFRHEPGAVRPSVLLALRGQVQVDAHTGELVRWQGGGWQPLPTRPPLARPTSVYGADGLVVVTAVAGGRPLVAVSFDRGVTWRRPRLVTLEGRGRRPAGRVVAAARRPPSQRPRRRGAAGAWAGRPAHPRQRCARVGADRAAEPTTPHRRVSSSYC